ncbi:hypothetical protein BH18ACT16_BH18ACT16_04730 [soil metagenome]
MPKVFCSQCRLSQPAAHRFCPRCGATMPHLEGAAKASRFFAGVEMAETDLPGAFLRVSCYRDEQVIHSPEGSVVVLGRHVPFSVWSEAEVLCVVSLPETEARALIEFVSEELGPLEVGSELDQPLTS